MTRWYYEYLEARTQKKDNLKPCPFCGAMPKYGNWAGGGAVWCDKCGAKITRDHEKGEEIDDFVLGGDIAADAWNRRVENEDERTD